jgi:hypothetical protein
MVTGHRELGSLFFNNEVDQVFFAMETRNENPARHRKGETG